MRFHLYHLLDGCSLLLNLLLGEVASLLQKEYQEKFTHKDYSSGWLQLLLEF
jgi:hypothetical protein